MTDEIKINIGDVWKDIEQMRINIGDAWKDVESVQINIGDTWKTAWRGVKYFKIRFRAKVLDPAILKIGFELGAFGDYEDVNIDSAVWKNFTTGQLSYYNMPCLSQHLLTSLVIYYKTNETEIYWISEIEVDIYDGDDNVLDTVKPNSDVETSWSSTGAAHYTELDQGVNTPDDNKYVSTSTIDKVERLGTENPAW